MEESKNSIKPDFSTLTGIMEYFHKVPFEQFKKELNEWFKSELAEKNKLSKSAGVNTLPDNFEGFIESIFKLAEEKDQQRLN